GGIGGFMLGGLLGSMLFGGHGAAGGGGGLGILDLLLLGGLGYLIYRAWRSWRASGGQRPSWPKIGSSSFSWPKAGSFPFSLPLPKGAASSPASLKNRSPGMMDSHAETHFFRDEPDLSPPGGKSGTVSLRKSVDTFSPPLTSEEEQESDLARGLRQIMLMDPRFQEDEFLAGARVAFELLQGAWRDWNVEQLRPLVTERMWTLVERQAREDKAAGRSNVIEKIHFASSAISEAWQESGEDFITVQFMVSMVDYITDAHGNVLEGDPDAPIQVEEYWTFVRPVSAPDPNWSLSAIQQPGTKIPHSS
ncbi:MAG: Tim44 domain-containing protein, partial [Magnetococcales bacterium]|nr:Tim44 domain-containing protein [Magnetococcales bacterium]